MNQDSSSNQQTSESERTDESSARHQETAPASLLPIDIKEAEAKVAEEWQVGDVILDLYEVKELLGEGGFGKVYRVRHKGWSVDLAVKTPRLDRLDEAAKENFRNEAETWVNLGLHPHAVSCYYVRDLGGIPRVFAEYVSGGSLSDWIRSRRLYEGGPETALKRILDIAIQFAWGLQYAHEQGLVHQDVKPANVMLTLDGVAKVTDFGLSQTRASVMDVMPQENPEKSIVVAGAGSMTPAYASPEQVAGHPLTRKTDIWSWAASVLEMFAGGLFWASGLAVEESLNSFLEEPSETDGLPGMSDEIIALLRRCFSHEVAQRPKDMLEVSSLLQGIYQQVDGKAYPRRVPKAAAILGDSLNNRAVSLLDLGKADEAEQLWEEALAIQAHHPESTYNRGLLRWRAAKMDDLQLVGQLRQAQGTMGANWRTGYLLSLIHLERDDAEAAIEVLEELEKLDPTRDVRNALAIAREQLPNSKRHLRTLEGHQGQVNSVVFERDGLHILSGSDDDTMKLWDVKTGRCVRTFIGGAAAVISVAPGYRPISEVTSVALSGDSQYALAHYGSPITPLDRDFGGYQSNFCHAIMLWDINTRRCLRILSGLTSDVNSAALSPDGRYILSGTNVLYDKDVDTAWLNDQNMWNRLKRWIFRSRSDEITMNLSVAENGHYVRALKGHKYRINSICFSHDSLYALSGGGDGLVKLWDVKTGRCLRTFEGHNKEVTSVSLSEDSRYALSGSEDRTIQLWETGTGRLVLTFKGHTERVMSVCIKGRFALSAGWEGTVKLWDVETGRCLRSFEGQPRKVTTVALSDDGHYGLSGGEELKLWKVSDGAYVAPLVLSQITASEKASRTEAAYESSLAQAREALDADNLTRALNHIKEARSLPGYQRSAEAVEMWTSLYRKLPRKVLNDGWEKATFKGGGGGISSVSLSRDGTFALSGGNDKKMKLWNVETRRCLRTFEGHEREVSTVSFSSDDRYALSGADDSSMKLWDIQTGESLRTFQGQGGFVRSACLTEDGQFVLSANLQGNALDLWDVKTGRCLRTFKGHTLQVCSADVSDDGRYALSGSYDSTFKLWDVETGQCLRTFEGHSKTISSVCINVDGKRALSASHDRTLKLWDVDTGRCIRTFEGHTDWVESISLSRDGRYVLSGSRDKTVKLWDVESGTCIRTFEGHVDAVTSVSLSHDMRYALSGSNDKTIKLWLLDWDLEVRETVAWDDRANVYLEAFLSSHTPYAGVLPNEREPLPREVTLALIRQGEPVWTEQDFQQLLYDLGCAGFGGLQRDGVRHELERLARDYSRPIKNVNEIELERSYAELRHGSFEFCTRCGHRVEPYGCNEVVSQVASRNYDTKLPYANRGEEAYWCEKCVTWWLAFGMGDTGQIWPCGHFMPLYVSICAVCGARLSR